jgi:hypothetical protein
LTLGIAPKRAKPRWLTLLVAVVGVMLITASIAFAGTVGTNAGFQDDDGNLIDDPSPATGIDWNSFATTAWTGTAPFRTSSKTFDGWTFRGIEDAAAANTDTAFAGGTKQDDNCATVGTGKAPNKDDLKRIYLATKVVSVSGVPHTFLELAWVRIPQNTTSPSAHIGFEFNKGSQACPAGSDGLVQRVAGDMLIVYDFEGGATDVPTITVRRWVLSGACEVSSNTAPCWGPSTNLTLSGFAEAKVNTFGSVSDTISPTSPTSVSLGTSEFGEAGIDLTAANIFAAGTCESFGKAFGVSRSSGNSGTAQMKDLIGPANFTLANCGTVIIRKVTDPSGDTTTSFGYTTNVTTNPATTTSPFSLKDGEHNTILNVVVGSGKTVTEGDPSPGYVLTGINCSASSVPTANISTSTGTRTVSFAIAGGETLDCTFTNTKQMGALSILKNSSKGGAVANAGAVFSYNSSSVTDNGTGDEDAATGSVCVSGLATGNYTVNETTAPTGYGDAPATEDDQTVTVVAGTNCTNNLPGAGATATFTNPPLSDIQVRFRDGGSGETSITSMTCDNTTGTSSTTATTGWDDTLTVSGAEAPTTIVCTIVIDP